MELMSKDSFAQSAAYLKQAVPLMIKYQIPTTPDNYTLWYNYVAASMPELNQAIARQDVKRLSRVPGIGNKTAERLLLELKGKVVASTAGAGAAPAVASPADDVVNALLALGYSEKEAAAACRDLPADQPLNDSIRQALKLLSKAK